MRPGARCLDEGLVMFKVTDFPCSGIPVNRAQLLDIVQGYASHQRSEHVFVAVRLSHIPTS